MTVPGQADVDVAGPRTAGRDVDRSVAVEAVEVGAEGHERARPSAGCRGPAARRCTVGVRRRGRRGRAPGW